MPKVSKGPKDPKETKVTLEPMGLMLSACHVPLMVTQAVIPENQVIQVHKVLSVKKDCPKTAQYLEKREKRDVRELKVPLAQRENLETMDLTEISQMVQGIRAWLT